MLTVKISLIIIPILLTGSTVARLECRKPGSVTEELNRASVVFSGEAVSKEYRKVDFSRSGGVGEAQVLVVKFKVNRWWKGGGAEDAVLYTSVTKIPGGGTSSLAEDFRFSKGESYLVYAYGPRDKLKTSACTRTRKLTEAEEDLRELGEGSAPKGKRE